MTKSSFSCNISTLLNAFSLQCYKATHIKSFVHDHPPASQKYFLIYYMNFDYCMQTKEKKTKGTKKHSTVINNFYFLVLDYLESWLNLMIVSMYVLDSRQVGDL